MNSISIIAAQGVQRRSAFFAKTIVQQKAIAIFVAEREWGSLLARTPVAGGLNSRHGFTLVEILCVMAIMAILTSVMLTAFNALGSSQGFGGQVSDFQQLFDDARAYALANNAYVLLGIEEVDASAAPTATPQTAGTGRVAVAVVGTTDGTNGLLSTGGSYSINQADLVALNQLRVFPNLHLQYLTMAVPTNSPLANRYSIVAGGSQDSSLLPPSQMIGYPGTTGASFTWPLNGPTQYTFNRVVEFGPEGSAVFVPTSGSASLSPRWLEIALQQAHGAAPPATPSTATLGGQGGQGAQVAAIQIDGITGASQLYRQ